MVRARSAPAIPVFPLRYGACSLVTTPTMKTLLIVSALLAVPVLGCEAEPPPRAPDAASAEPEITRDVAVKMARTDAATRFRDFGTVSFANAQSLGRYWVVELHATSGQGLRYAISRNDGAVKERTMIR